MGRHREVIHGLVSDDDDGPIGWIQEIVLDSADVRDLTRFWAGLLGGTLVEWYPGWITLEPPPHAKRLSFQCTARVRGGARAGSGQLDPVVHFDVLVGDPGWCSRSGHRVGRELP